MLDIALVIDCSGSIRDTNPPGVDNWQLILNFVDNLVSSINVGEQETHVGAVTFGTQFNATVSVYNKRSCVLSSSGLYGTAWVIRFNPTKSQLITFGGPNPSVCGIHNNGKPLHWVNKIKYLGVYLLCNTGHTDITDSVRKFYGKFNNIMAVLSKHSNEMTTLHPVKSYCLPALLYCCEVWHLIDSSMQNISVAWNNCFRRIFSCCRRESVKPLQYFAAHCQNHSCYTSANYCF